MRKILLATTALVAFAGAAQAAESPIQVTVGGYVDFRAALFHEAEKPSFDGIVTGDRRHGDFATEYGLNIAAEGKAAGGIEYGSMITLNNRDNTSADQIRMDGAYVWMSGAFGKVLMGDEHGASDLFVMAPTVGEGQIDGDYSLFTDAFSLAQFKPAYIDTLENNTKFTYYTPKVGNANHKVQLGVSYTPGYNEVGNDAAIYRAEIDTYRDVVETAIQYTGNFSPVNVAVTPMMAFGEGESNSADLRDFTLWGIGAQAMYAGFTLGGSYVDAGHMGTTKNTDETKNQNVWTVGLKYEFDKVALATNFMRGKGYYDLYNGTTTETTTIDGNVTTITANTAGHVYVDRFSALGFGATYTWFPGLTTAADAVFFDQNREDNARNNIGHVLMLSQKMAF